MVGVVGPNPTVDTKKQYRVCILFTNAILLYKTVLRMLMQSREGLSVESDIDFIDTLLRSDLLMQSMAGLSLATGILQSVRH